MPTPLISNSPLERKTAKKESEHNTTQREGGREGGRERGLPPPDFGKPRQQLFVFVCSSGANEPIGQGSSKTYHSQV